ncbi:MAG: hypothetical protein AAF927_07670 [Bacteroidota bacterium]
MKPTVLFWLSFLFSFSPLQAQLSIELGSGGEIGWWVQNNGYNDTLTDFHQGYDRSHLAFFMPAELSLSYQHQKWRFSLGGGYRYFDDNVLIGTDNARGNFSRYRIQTEGEGVDIWLYQLGVEYLFVDQPRFSMSPFFNIGGFFSNATIPEPEISKAPWHYNFGLELSAKLGPHFQWYFRPRYIRQIINYEQPVFRDLQQNIYSIGIFTGIRLCL